MKITKISEMSNQNKEELLQLTEALKDVEEQKEFWTKKIDPYYVRMNEIIKEENSLDKKYEELISDKNRSNPLSTSDADELSRIISRTNELSSERDEINGVSDELYETFHAIIKQAEEILGKIDDIINRVSVEKKVTEASIMVDSINGRVSINKPSIEGISILPIDSNKCAIINCTKGICDKIRDTFSKNEKAPVQENKNKYDMLITLYLENKKKEESIVDENLMYLENTLVSPEVKIVIDEPKEIIEPKNVIEEPIKEDVLEESNMVKLSDIITFDDVKKPEINTSNVSSPSIIYINNPILKNKFGRIAKAPKDRLSKIREGFSKLSTGETVVKYLHSDMYQNNDKSNIIDIENFIGVPKTA